MRKFSIKFLTIGLLLLQQNFGQDMDNFEKCSNLFNITTTTTTTTTTAKNNKTAVKAKAVSVITLKTSKPTTMGTTTKTPSEDPYCQPSLCELFNGSHTQQLPHIACQNHGNFGTACGTKPHLLYMNERRRNLILDLHNLARSRIATGQVTGYKSASHMPQLKWENELAYLAVLHAKRCKFVHDQCHNTQRFRYSGQNIAYYWIRREIKSHSGRMKNFIANWFGEHVNANQSYIDSYQPHSEGKIIEHFTLLTADRVHRVGCAAVRFSVSNITNFLMTCNYDFTNFLDEQVYESGPSASKCLYKKSERFPGLCDWKDPIYDYESAESIENVNEPNNILDF
uniref:Venom allergen-1 n=1 Tax=Glossina brevipalpis TaxID=37001 RepID=A0A1A9X011_9MUSC